MSFRKRLVKNRRNAARNAATRRTRAPRIVRGELKPKATGGSSHATSKKTRVKKKTAAAKQGRHLSKKKVQRKKKAVAKKSP